MEKYAVVEVVDEVYEIRVCDTEVDMTSWVV
jgi:hypothetical protein